MFSIVSGVRVLPRFKYFISLSEIIADGIKLISADMQDCKLVPLFEDELKKYFNKDFCYTISSYRMGVYFYLKSLNLAKGSEILVTPITIPDLINVILLLDLKPVFVDMDEENHSISVVDLEKKLSSRSRVLILTYLSGLVTQQDSLRTLIKDNNLKVIEDISQAYGSKIEKRSPFIGDIQIGSLSSGKLISTYTGGFAVLDCKETYDNILTSIKGLIAPPKKRFVFEVLSNIKIYLATSRYTFPIVYTLFWFMWRLNPSFMEGIAKSKMYTRSEENDIFFDDYPIRRKEIPEGWKTRLCSWQATIGLRFLSQLDSKTEKRQRLGKILFSHLNEKTLRRIPNAAFNTEFNFYHIPFSLVEDKRQELRGLFDRGIDSEGYGLNLCNSEKIFSELCCYLPNAFNIKYKSVFLPLHESYSEYDMIKMARSLNAK